MCEKAFTQKPHLNTHTKVVHKGDKPKKCPHCDATFSVNKGLSQHIKAVHDGKKLISVLIAMQHFQENLP